MWIASRNEFHGALTEGASAIEEHDATTSDSRLSGCLRGATCFEHAGRRVHYVTDEIEGIGSATGLLD